MKMESNYYGVCEKNKYRMGTSTARSSSNTEYFMCGDKIPGLQVCSCLYLTKMISTIYHRSMGWNPIIAMKLVFFFHYISFY